MLVDLFTYTLCAVWDVTYSNLDLSWPMFNALSVTCAARTQSTCPEGGGDLRAFNDYVGPSSARLYPDKAPTECRA